MINRIKNEILNISYSALTDWNMQINSVEMYSAACKAGFNVIKGDVAPCRDGKLIMCHDAYFDFDENGRVTAPGHGVYRKYIEDLPYEVCKNLEYGNEGAYKELGHYPKVAELEDLVRVCKENGTTPYITVRYRQINVVVNEVYRILKKYDMVNNCIINSFTRETLKAMRALDKDICLSLVYGPNEVLTRDHVDFAIQQGNCVVCVFWLKDAQHAGFLYRDSLDAINYAKENGIVLHLAHAFDKDCYKLGLERGFKGFQCMVSDAFR